MSGNGTPPVDGGGTPDQPVTPAMTLAQALARAATLGLARLDAQLLLLHAVGRGQGERAWLLAHDTAST